MLELKKLYNRVSKQTQNKLQEILDTFHFNFDNLYNVADNKIKHRVNRYIEEWKDKGLLTEYFGMLANNIYRRTRVKNSEILELLIYGAYVEEQNKLDEYEKQIIYDDVNYYYQEGQKEVNNTLRKKKSISIIDMALFLYLLNQPNYTGLNLNQCIQTTIQYNANQIYRQVLINIQQQKDLEIENNEFQRIINQQNNQKLCINGNKISGFMDNQMIGMNNLAKVKGIKKQDNDAKVRFIAVIDEKETDMCHSLDEQIFYIDKENIFDRYYGETQKDLRIQRIKCKGLVLGLNLPPISHHFHWCRSTITYQVQDNKSKEQMEKKFNIFSSAEEKNIENKYNINKARMKGIDKVALENILENMKKAYKDFPQVEGKIKNLQSIEHPNGGMNIMPDLKDNKHVMQINKKFFNSEKTAEEQYNKDLKSGFHPEGTTYKDMGIHELGHSVTFEIIKNKYNTKKAISNDWNKNITAKEIVQEAFKNLEINDKLTKDILRNNISNYAVSNYGETIGEAFADYYSNREKSNILSKEIIKVMKGMV